MVWLICQKCRALGVKSGHGPGDACPKCWDREAGEVEAELEQLCNNVALMPAGVLQLTQLTLRMFRLLQRRPRR